jgi:hypothetical protein
MSSAAREKDALTELVHDKRFLVKPVYPGTEELQAMFDTEVLQVAQTTYDITHKLLVSPKRRTPTAQDSAIAGLKSRGLTTHAELSRFLRLLEEKALNCFVAVTRKYLLGGSMGPRSGVSDGERYVFKTLVIQPRYMLRHRDVAAFIASRCLAGDVRFFKRLGAELGKSRGNQVKPYNKIDYAMAWYWTCPLMPLWAMTDEAGSKALSIAISRPVQKESYKKVRKALGLPTFISRAIREVRTFKNGKVEYVYFRSGRSPKKG